MQDLVTTQFYLGILYFLAFIIYFITSIFLAIKDNKSVLSSSFSVCLLLISIAFALLSVNFLVPELSIEILNYLYIFIYIFTSTGLFFSLYGIQSLTLKSTTRQFYLIIGILIIIQVVSVFGILSHQMSFDTTSRFSVKSDYLAILIFLSYIMPTIFSLYFLHKPNELISPERRNWVIRLRKALYIALLFPISDLILNSKIFSQFVMFDFRFVNIGLLFIPVIILFALPKFEDWLVDKTETEKLDLLKKEGKVNNIREYWQYN